MPSATPAGAQTASSPNANPAYWLVASDGGIFAFGGSGFYGSTGAMTLNKPVVGMAASASKHGYWLVASDGGIFSFGDAQFYGSTGAMTLNKPVVGMAPTNDGAGYWLVASDGGIFSFGDAPFYGSMGGQPLNKPVVGMTATPDGGGYWLVASDGGIFAFGDAGYYGSTGAIVLNRPIVSMTPTADGKGYWFTASDGGIFAYGDAPYLGSLGGSVQARPIVSMASTPTGQGYWLVNSNGGVFNFGDARPWGSAPQVLTRPVVGMTETAGSGFTGAVGPYPSGSYGYDISNYQCNSLPPAPYSIGIVETNGWGSASPNVCLSAEANWAGGTLNLYTYLACDDSGRSAPTCTYASGYAEGQFAFQTAVNAGINTQTAWWLDVEGHLGCNPNSWCWSATDQNANSLLVQGAIDGIKAEGINTVGIYSSPGIWNSIVGNYQPVVPYWMADYLNTPSGPGSCADYNRWVSMGKLLPSGGLVMVQYNSSTYDDDYAC